MQLLFGQLLEKIGLFLIPSSGHTDVDIKFATATSAFACREMANVSRRLEEQKCNVSSSQQRSLTSLDRSTG